MLILGAGWFGSNFFWAFYSGPMPLFLKRFTDSKFSISIVLSLAGVASCTVPPIVGYLSDRSSGRFGRRKPFIVGGMLGALPCLLILPHAGTFAAVVLLSAVLYFAIAVAETPMFSLLPDITPVDQRSTASGVVHLIGSLGLIIFFFLSSRIWDAHPTAVFRLVAAVSIGAASTVILLIQEPTRTSEMPKRAFHPIAYVGSIVRETQAMKYFSAQFFWWLGFYMVSSFMTLFAVEELGASEGNSMYVPAALTVVSTVAMYPLGVLGDRVGRKKLLSLMIGLWGVLGFLIALSRTLPQAIVTVGLTGLPFAAILGVGYAYMLDLIPRERTAEFVGFSIISISAPMVIGTILAGKLVDQFGYRPLFPAASFMMFVGLAILQFTSPQQDHAESTVVPEGGNC